MNKPIVTVIILTYNHESYIEQALNSVLVQKTDFQYEVIIGNDASTDKTGMILERLISERGDNDYITLISREQNTGLVKNTLDIIQKSKGRYLAFLEGDDYWIGEDKLQTQIDFLEANECYASCFGRALVTDANGNAAPTDKWNSREKDVTCYSELDENWCIPTSGLVVRNVFTGNDHYLELFSNSVLLTDRLLHVLCLRHGSLKYIDKVMSAYRFGIAGSWSVSPPLPRFNDLVNIMGIISTVVPPADRERALYEMTYYADVCKFLANKPSEKRKCPICGMTGEVFFPARDYPAYNHAVKNIMIGLDNHPYACRCGAKGKDRHLFAYLGRLGLLQDNGAVRKTLYFSGESAVSRVLSVISDTFINIDIISDATDAQKKPPSFIGADADLPFKDECFDLIICCDTLYRIKNDIFLLSEIRRVLKNSGKAILQTPYSQKREKTYENPRILAPNDRLLRYGGHDRYRLYGRDYFERIMNAGFKLNIVKHADVFEENEAELFGVDAREDLICAVK